MKAVILAGGSGTRLGIEYADKSKHLLEIGGETILDHQINNFRRYGVDNFVFITGHRPDLVESAMDGKGRFVYGPKGMVNAMLAASQEFLFGCYFVQGDVIFHPNMLEEIAESNDNLALLVDTMVPYDEEQMKVQLKDSRPVRISKSLSRRESNGEYVGIAKYSQQGGRLIYEKLHQLAQGGLQNLPKTDSDIHQALIDDGHTFTVFDTKGLPWTEIDFLRDLERARNEVMPRIKAIPVVAHPII